MTSRFSDRTVFRPLEVGRSTFKGGVDAPIHRWFRLTASYGPELVRHALQRLDAGPDAWVLDPFSGAGTTAITCRHLDRSCRGFEINPLLQFVCRVSLTDPGPVSALSECLAAQGAGFRARRRELAGVPLEERPHRLPTIHNVYRWWRPDVLGDLLIIREQIEAIADPTVRDFFRLALAGALVPDLTNVTLGRLQLHFIDRTHDVIDAWQIYARHAGRMIDDVSAPRARTQAVDLADSTSPPEVDWRADVVVTSPPYPNRYSYVWNTRPHLYFFEFFTGRSEATVLDKRTIGGTWGTATAMLAKGEIAAEHPAVAAAAGETVAEIRARDNLMANYLMKYANLLSRQIRALEGLTRPGARAAYVVGNSRLKGVYVATDEILAGLFEGLGWQVSELERFRRRHSGKDLYETLVFAER